MWGWGGEYVLIIRKSLLAYEVLAYRGGFVRSTKSARTWWGARRLAREAERDFQSSRGSEAGITVHLSPTADPAHLAEFIRKQMGGGHDA